MALICCFLPSREHSFMLLSLLECALSHVVTRMQKDLLLFWDARTSNLYKPVASPTLAAHRAVYS